MTIRSRAIARALTIITILALALPAAAADCATGTITPIDTSHHWSPVVELDELNLSIEGDFLWVQPDDGAVLDEYDGTQSVEVPIDAIGATVCLDGTVTFNYPPDPVNSVPDPSTEVEVSIVLDLALAGRFGPR